MMKDDAHILPLNYPSANWFKDVIVNTPCFS